MRKIVRLQISSWETKIMSRLYKSTNYLYTYRFIYEFGRLYGEVGWAMDKKK
jgi:hypothetical protein